MTGMDILPILVSLLLTMVLGVATIVGLDSLHRERSPATDEA